MALKTGTAAGKILHNSFWTGLESVIEALVFLGTSIAVARYLGPAKLGYFSYINFFVNVITRTSGTGLSTATRKYMSEFIALDRVGTAHAVYHLAHRYQLIGSVSITVLGLAGVALFGEPGYKLMSSILVLSIIPGMMSWVPAQANNAFEDVSDNTLSALAYIGVYGIVIVLTLHYRWDLPGVALATLIGRTSEVLLRTFLLSRILRSLPLDTLDREVKDRIRRFCLQAAGIQVLMAVVWDRSEMVFLRHYSTLVQTAFYSVAFTFGGNLLLLPRIFTGSTGITLMVEAVRDPKRVNSLMRNASRYLLLMAIPVCMGAAAIALPAIGFAYGERYLAAVPVMMLGSLLIIPRVFQELPELLLRTADLQNRILVWYGITGVVNLGLDFLFIPHHGALAAVWANGLAQAFGVAAIWYQARRVYKFSFPVAAAIRITLASAGMAVVAYSVSRHVAGIPGLVLAILAAIPIFLVLLRLLRGLEPSDRQRLAPIANRLPAPARKAWIAAVSFVTAPAA